MAEYVGAKLRVTTEESTYEGIVHSIDPVRRRLTLSQVTSFTKGKPPKKLHGFQNFFGHELNNLEIIEKSDSSEDSSIQKEKQNVQQTSLNYNTKVHPTSSMPSNASHGHLPCRSQQQAAACQSSVPSQNTDYLSPQSTTQTGHVNMFRNAMTSAGILSKRSTQTQGKVTKDASDEGTVLIKRPPIVAEQYLMDDDNFSDDEEELSPQSPPKTIILDEYNDRFENAIKYINNQRVVGLSCEAVHLGRHGRICWVVIGCRYFTYLFDVVTLGGSCFDKGIAEILENGNVLKVTHDCRQLSDALFHQHSIKLVNVFDTQVADIIIYKNEKGGNLPRVVNGLIGCLYEYLNLSPEQCHFQKVRISNMQKDESIWSRRPLSQQVIDSAAKRVMYLRELRLAQMERMMAEFIFGVDIYLSVVRDAKDYRVTDRRYASKSRQVPQQFQELFKFRNRRRTRKFDEGFAEEAQDDVTPDEPEHTNNAWLEGERFTNTHRNKHGRIKEQAMEPLPGWEDSLQAYGGSGFTNTDSSSNNIKTMVHNLGFSGESGESTGDSDNPFHFGSLNVNEEQLANELGNVNISQNLPQPNISQSVNSTKHFESFDLRERDSRSFHSISGQTLGLNNRSTSDGSLSNGPPYANDFGNTTTNSAIFKSEDFPALSDSFSDNSFSSTPPTNQTVNDSRNTANNVNGSRGSPLNSYSQSGYSHSHSDNSSRAPPVSRPATESFEFNTRNENTFRSQSPQGASSFGFSAGRGRASLFQHMSSIPKARLPKMDDSEPPWRSQPATAVGGLRNRHAFPSDNELLATSEVTVVPNPSSVHGGTRVRVRQI